MPVEKMATTHLTYSAPKTCVIFIVTLSFGLKSSAVTFEDADRSLV